MSRELADHLRYYAELGVEGVSKNAQWRTREADRDSVAAATAEADSVATAKAVALHVEGEKSPGIFSDHMEGEGFSPRHDTLDQIKTDIGPACMRCKLCTLGRSRIVFGVGNPKARLMFVGEAPGEEEDKRGEPFVGKAGQLLTKIIEAIGLTREQVYIANIIKCRPPNNRNPEPDEIEQCEPFLFRQVDAIKPKVVVPLGKFATQSLLKTTDPITRLRGQLFKYRGAACIPTFHPAYLLRNPSSKREVWEDMKKVRAILQDE